MYKAAHGDRDCRETDHEKRKYDCLGTAACKDKLLELKMATRETRTLNQKSAMITIVENLPCGIGIGGYATEKLG